MGAALSKCHLSVGDGATYCTTGWDYYCTTDWDLYCPADWDHYCTTDWDYIGVTGWGQSWGHRYLTEEKNISDRLGEHPFYQENIVVVTWVPSHIHRPQIFRCLRPGPHLFPCSSMHWTIVFCIGVHRSLTDWDHSCMTDGITYVWQTWTTYVWQTGTRCQTDTVVRHNQTRAVWQTGTTAARPTLTTMSYDTTTVWQTWTTAIWKNETTSQTSDYKAVFKTRYSTYCHRCQHWTEAGWGKINGNDQRKQSLVIYSQL